jgi:hypothetical protein
VGDIAGAEQANFEVLIFEIFSKFSFENFLHFCRIQWPGEAAHGRIPGHRRAGTWQAEEFRRTWSSSRG